VYRVVARVPRGRFSTFGDIAAFLDVMPRHVAFLLAKLPPDVREVLPWHRVLSGEGQVPDKARVAAAAWHALLEGEGVLFVDGVATRRSGSP
jgi:methylated-DNA-protein-cysteine methyltransferase-like protein